MPENIKTNLNKNVNINIRSMAVDTLLSISKEGALSHILLKKLFSEHKELSPKDRAFLSRLVEGTLEQRIYIDYIIGKFSKTPVNKLKPFIRELLRVSTYQMLFMDRVPVSAAVNEAVKLAQKRGFAPLKGFINAVLRNIDREGRKVQLPDKEKSYTEYLSVRYSMPLWLTEQLLDEQGAEKIESILAGLLQNRPTCIRLKQGISENDREAVLAELKDSGISYEKDPYLDYAFRIEGSFNPEQYTSFKKGLFTIMDTSSMLAVEAAQITGGMSVLDVCAAPGGKLFLAAEKTGSEGQVLGRDVTEKKLQLLRENKERLGLENVSLKVQDARIYDEELKERFDVVIADLPCSGIGVTARKKEIKYRIDKEQIAELSVLQSQILDTVWQYVKPGGVLMYSTCTISRRENEEQAKNFAENYPFEAESFELPGGLSGKGGKLQLLPGINDTDGFFMAKFRRV